MQTHPTSSQPYRAASSWVKYYLSPGSKLKMPSSFPSVLSNRFPPLPSPSLPLLFHPLCCCTWCPRAGVRVVEGMPEPLLPTLAGLCHGEQWQQHQALPLPCPLPWVFPSIPGTEMREKKFLPESDYHVAQLVQGRSGFEAFSHSCLCVIWGQWQWWAGTGGKPGGLKKESPTAASVAQSACPGVRGGGRVRRSLQWNPGPSCGHASQIKTWPTRFAFSFKN